MKRAKKVLALALALVMLSSTFTTLGSAITGGHFAEVEESEADASITYEVSIYRNAGTTDAPDWVPTEVAKPGEEVRARVAIDSGGKVTQAGDMIIVWDSDMFTDLIPTDTDEVDFAVNSNDSFTKTYEAKARIYSSGYEAWDYLAENIDYYDDDDVEYTYISEEIHDKYENSWAYVFFSSTTTGVLSKDTWLFEIPLKVKDDATSTEMAAGVVEDAFTGYYIGLCNDKEYDLSPESYAPMFGLTLGTSQWFDAYLPYVTTKDAVLSTTNSVKLDANGGTLPEGVTSATGTVGSTANLPTSTATAPAGKSNTNVKWSTNQDCDYADAVTTAPIGYEIGDNAPVYYAIYDNASGIAYTVNTFEMATDGTYDEENPSVATCYGVAAATADATAVEGYSVPTGFELDTAKSKTTDTIAADGSTVLNVYFKRSTCSATWNGAAGTTPVTTTGLYGTAITAPADATPPTGMSFAGWSTSADGEATTSFGNYDTTPAEFFALFTYNAKDISFDPNGGTWKDETLDGVETRKFDFGAKITAPGDAEKVGYTFKGWADSSTATAAVTLGNVDENTPATYYAVYAAKTYRFKYYTDNTFTDAASGTKAVVFSDNAVLNKTDLSVTAPTGQHLDHWAIEKDGATDFFTDDVYTLTGEEAALTTLYPVFANDVHNLTITYFGAGENTPAQYNGEFEYGKTYEVNSPDVEGYTPTPAVVSGTMGTANVEKEVIYSINTYYITYKVQGKEDVKVPYTFGANVATPSNPDVEGYTFTGWDTEIPATMPAKDLTIEALFDKNNYTITYFVDGEEKTELSQTVAYGDSFTLAAKPADPDGKTMGNWVLYNGENEISKPDTMPAYNIVAKATSVANGYKVKYYVDGVEQKDLEKTVEFGTALPGNPTYIPAPGYSVSDWVTDYTGTTMPDHEVIFTAETTPIEYSVILYAKDAIDGAYDELDTWPGYNINDKIMVDDLEDSADDAYIFGYDVIGWSLTADGDVIVPVEDVVATFGTEDIELYAIYAPKTVIVSFVVDRDNDVVENVDYSFGDAITPYDVTGAKPGHVFKGWLKLDLEGEERTPVTDWTNEIVDQEDDSMIVYVADWDPADLPLVITYTGAGSKTPDKYEGTVKYLKPYEVKSPDVTGYTATPAVVEGTMDDVDGKSVTVTYTANSYAIEITYTGAGDKTPDKYENTVVYGQTYNVASPAITGYDVAPAAITGTMDENGVKETVTYTPKQCALTIVYKGAGDKTPDPVNTTVAFDSTFSVDSPAITGYKADIEKVEGTMDSVSGKSFTVTYAPELCDLTIHYQYADESKAADDYIGKVAFDSAYSVDSPEIENFVADIKTVSGTMNDVNGKEITVTYTGADSKTTLVIDIPGQDKPTEIDVTGEYGEEVTVDPELIPEIPGYTRQPADPITVIIGEDEKVEITYTANNYPLIIHYQYADKSKAAEDYEGEAAFDSTYSVDSPVIENYVADYATVTGTMDDVNGKEITVTYTGEDSKTTLVIEVPGKDEPIEIDVTGEYGEEVTVDPELIPEIPGYTRQPADPITVVIGEDEEVVITYVPEKFDITFDANGGTFAEGAVTSYTDVECGSEIAAPVVSKQGYEFAGWSPAFTGKVPADDTTYVAQWSDGTTTPYTVEIYMMNTDGTYFENPTASITGNQGTTGSTVTLNTTTNIPEGFYFDEANSVPSGVIASDGSLVLKICYARNAYTVSFDGEETTVYHGAAIDYPEADVEPGQTFLGWSKTEGATEADTDLPVYATEDLELYSVIAEGKFTVTYFVDYGTGFEAAKTASYAYGEAIEEYVPTMEGYTFSGWNEAVPATMPAEDLVRYASFTLNTWKVTYVSDIDDSVVAEFDVNYGADVPAIDAPEVDFYTFREFNGYVAAMPDNDLTVYVCYDRVPVKLIPKTPEASTIIDRDLDLVYGLDDYLTYNRLVDEFLDVEGDGYMVITPVETYNNIGLYGTGSTVDVYDRVTGELVESFTIIVFGDVNGDGRVTSTDVSIVATEVAGNTEWGYDASEDYDIIKAIAADANHDGFITTSDTNLILEHVATVDEIDQCPDLSSYAAPIG